MSSRRSSRWALVLLVAACPLLAAGIRGGRQEPVPDHCPPKVSMIGKGTCQDYETREELVTECCEVTSGCLKGAEELLAYYVLRMNTYRAECGVSLQLQAGQENNASLHMFEEPEVNLAEICSDRCKAALVQKPPINFQALVRKCQTTTDPANWRDKLQTIRFPRRIVLNMDEAARSCDEQQSGDETGGSQDVTPLVQDVTPLAEAAEKTEAKDMSPTLARRDSDRSSSSGNDDFEFMVSVTERQDGAQQDQDNDVLDRHFCARHAHEGETYYASSLCYWIPEDGGRPSKLRQSGKSLRWVYEDPRTSPAGKSDALEVTCGKLNGEGRCMKCSVCHNNRRSKDGLTMIPFVEELRLPKECLKETQIQRVCERHHEKEVAAELLDSLHKCKMVEGLVSEARWEMNEKRILVDRLTLNIGAHNLRGDSRKNPRNFGTALGEKMRTQTFWVKFPDDAVNACQRYVRSSGPEKGSWLDALRTEEFQEAAVEHARNLQCVAPEPFFGSGRQGARLAYLEKFKENQYCERCKNALQPWLEAYDALAHAAEAISEQQLERLEHFNFLSKEVNSIFPNMDPSKYMERIRQWLQDAQRELKKRRNAFGVLARDWEAMREKCEADAIKYAGDKFDHVAQCSGALYNQSCERACIDLQTSSNGCGIIEGSKPGDKLFQGGMEAQCDPPARSWFTSAFSAGEARQEMCDRIAAGQSSKYKQTATMSGWLTKKQLMGFRRRYFVLEPGDTVRTAVIRYFTDADPSAGGKERWNKAIKIHKDTVVKPEGLECFKITNGGQEHVLCAQGGKKGTDAAGIRDQWVAALQAEIARHSTTE